MAYDVDYSRQKRKAREQGRSAGPIICKKRMGLSKSCEYCDAVAKLYQSEEKSDKDLASKCRARSTFYMNIVDLDNKEDGAQIYGCGVENWRDLLDRLPDPDDSDDDGIDYIKPSSARTVIIKRRGVGLKTDYTISIGNKKLIIKKRWLKSLHPLHKVQELIDNDEVELWKPKKGKNRLYICPPWSKKAEGDFYYESIYHWNTDGLNLGSSEDGDEDDDGNEYEDWGGDNDDNDDIPF